MTSLAADLGIRLKHERPGEHRAACPACAKVKLRRGDGALAVKVDPDGGATWICHRCGWKGSTRAPGASQERRKVRGKDPAPKPERPPAGLPASAAALWSVTSLIGADTIAGRYLAARGCALPHPEGDLRFLANHRHPSGWWCPCLVALVTDAVTTEPLTLHRTWIQEDGTKASINKPRLLWPGLPKTGGVVRLWPDEVVTLGLCVAEGIETALTAAAGFGLAWSTIDAGNLETLPVLTGIEALTIVADNDPAGFAAADACARRWAAAGVEVRRWLAPTPRADFNDFAAGAAA